MTLVRSERCGFPPESDDKATIIFTGKELEFIRNSLVVLLKQYISKLYGHSSSEVFNVHYYDSDELVVCIHEIYTLLSDFDYIFNLDFKKTADPEADRVGE